MQRLMTDRPIYKIRRRQFDETEFPVKVRPLEDELLSSWLIRTALEHKTQPTTFTNLYLPETRNRLWAGDIELHADDALLQRLSAKSALSVEILTQMTFRAYEGVLFERLHPNTGGTPFLLKYTMRGRWSRSPGIRWCPECLSEDEQPYFRKKWRLALFTVCLKHRKLLVDKCIFGTPLTLYKAKWDNKKPFCPKCGACLADTILSERLEYIEGAIETQNHLQRIIRDGYIMLDSIPIYSHLFFTVLHQILKILLSKRYGHPLRLETQLQHLESFKNKSFESIPTREQSQILTKAVWLLNDWPHRFIGICYRKNVVSSTLLKDMEQAPFWYWNEIVS